MEAREPARAVGLSPLGCIFRIGIKSVSSEAREAVVRPICVVSGLLALNRNNSFALSPGNEDNSFSHLVIFFAVGF